MEPLRLIHEHTDDGPMDNFYRFEPEGDATRLIVESDYEMPGNMPGFIKDLMTKGWIERQHAPDARGLQGARRGEGPGPGLRRS